MQGVDANYLDKQGMSVLHLVIFSLSLVSPFGKSKYTNYILFRFYRLPYSTKLILRCC